MKITPHFILSATIGFGLTAFTVLSALIAGMAASTTVLGFGFLAIYGLLEIAILSYAAPRASVRPARVRRAPALVAMSTRSRVRVPAIIERPLAVSTRQAA